MHRKHVKRTMKLQQNNVNNYKIIVQMQQATARNIGINHQKFEKHIIESQLIAILWNWFGELQVADKESIIKSWWQELRLRHVDKIRTFEIW